jgi:hypothetical protein
MKRQHLYLAGILLMILGAGIYYGQKIYPDAAKLLSLKLASSGVHTSWHTVTSDQHGYKAAFPCNVSQNNLENPKKFSFMDGCAYDVKSAGTVKQAGYFVSGGPLPAEVLPGSGYGGLRQLLDTPDDGRVSVTEGTFAGRPALIETRKNDATAADGKSYQTVLTNNWLISGNRFFIVAYERPENTPDTGSRFFDSFQLIK